MSGMIRLLNTINTHFFGEHWNNYTAKGPLSCCDFCNFWLFSPIFHKNSPKISIFQFFWCNCLKIYIFLARFSFVIFYVQNSTKNSPAKTRYYTTHQTFACKHLCLNVINAIVSHIPLSKFILEMLNRSKTPKISSCHNTQTITQRFAFFHRMCC